METIVRMGRVYWIASVVTPRTSWHGPTRETLDEANDDALAHLDALTPVRRHNATAHVRRYRVKHSLPNGSWFMAVDR